MKSILKNKYAVIATIFWFLFSCLFISVMMRASYITDINVYFFNKIVDIANPSIEYVWRVITSFGGAGVISFLTAISALYLWLKNDIGDAIIYSVSIVSGTLLTYIFKIFSASNRPEFLYAIEKTYSFPSGHTALVTIFSIVTTYVFTRKLTEKFKTLVLFLPVIVITLVGYSRLRLGEHWFFDVLGGLFLGLAASATIIYFSRIYKNID